MQRLRSTWMALMGGILLVTLSISAAFGAAPAGTAEGTRGQSIAAFVHSIVFGQDTDDDAGDILDEDEEDGELDEDLDEEDLEEDELQEDQLQEDQLQEDENEEEDESGTHGECVSEVAHDKDGENDPEGSAYANHGERVSEAARVTCWDGDDELEEDEDVDETLEEDEELDDEEESEDEDSHGQCVKRVARDRGAIGGPNENHGGAVSFAARVTCWGGEADDEDDENGDADASESDEAADDSDEGTTAAAGRGKASEVRGQGRGGGPKVWSDGSHPGKGHASGGPGGNGNGRGGGRGGR